MSKLEEVGVNKKKLTIEVSPEAFEEAVQKAYLKKRKDIKVDGFRPGKAPRNVIETQYGKGVFYEDAVDLAFPDAYRAAIEEHNLFPVSNPDLSIEKIGKEDGLVFTAEVWVKPEVKLSDYKKIKAKRVEPKVTDKDVKAELDKIVEQSARWVEVEREAKDGDRVTIDFSGSVDGEKFEGGTAEGYSLDLGSNTFIEGFEPQLVGMKIGEEKDVKVTFPKEYQAENLAGKEAVFACKLHKVQEKELPKVDDDFAQDVSEFETLAEYKKDIKAQLMVKAVQSAKNETENNVITALVEKSKVEIPDVMIDNQIDYHIKQFEYQLMYQGLNIDGYLQYTGTTLDDLKAQYKEQAENTVKSQLVLESVMEKENIKADEKEVDAELEKNAKQMNKSLDEYKKDLPANQLDSIETKIAFDKTIDFLVSNADF
ncbi:MAG: trigger factor [Eubacteriales bacterium]